MKTFIRSISARSQIYDYGGMPDYDENSGFYESNESYGFDTSIDGLLNPEHNAYYVAIGALKNGAKYLVKDKYNAELKLMDSFTYTTEIRGK